MMQTVARKVTYCLIQNERIEQENEEKYIYGVEVVIEKLITYGVLLILALSLKILVPSVLFVLFFALLRGYTGGFHARTYLGCFISTILMYLCCCQVIAPFLIKEKLYIIPGIIISSIFILLFAPINNPDLNLSAKEIKRCKIGTKLVLMLEVISIAMGIYSGISTVYIVFPFLGIVMCAVLLIVAKIIQREV